MAHLSTDDGYQLWTEVTGDGPPVVLVHGGPGWWDVFQDLALPGFRLHRWDQRGCGRSDRRGPYTLERFVADLETVRQSTGHAKVVLMGHSWGAALALQYAGVHLDHISRLVLVSSTGLDGPPSSYRRRVAEILAREPSDDPWIARISTGFADRSTALDHANRLNTPRFEPNQLCADALLAALRAVPDRAEACRRIAGPTLLIHGAEDLRPPAVTDSLLKALPNAERVVLDGVAHYPWIEDPDGFQKAVQAFVS
ncbi:proline iminopeptidase [Kribbella steppae]|uniref:Proline iminopeptidase n=1 Tax=Kribbella steppae TaxID=2512223 RepID=A0A4R2HJX1_9ACTN|nr:alpha/beta fold hydrolase [Kribbella steppae]TCO30133.1 proline iminopeptidase [Kribbella steppae]